MSNFRDRTRAIVAQGEQERKSFAPKGAPARLYNYWLDNSRSDKAAAIRSGRRRENFCHWFWTMLILAPALAFGRFIDRHAWLIAVPILVAVVALFWALIADFGIVSVLIGIGIAIAFIAALAGLIVGVEALHKRFPVAMGRIGVGLVIAAFASVVVLLAFAFISSTGTVGAVIVTALFLTVAGIVWKFQDIASYIEGREEQKLRERIERKYEEPAVVAEPREPGALSKFFKGAGEFIVMVAQFVRVKKWKTCPLIDVTPEQRGEVSDAAL